MIKMVVFDWDGTLINSGATICRCVNQVAADFSLPERSYPQVAKVVGLDLAQALQTVFADCAATLPEDDLMVASYRAAFAKQPHQQSDLFAGVVETLTALKSHGIILAIATGKSRHGLDLDLAATGLQSMFDYSICADESCSKPNPAMLNELMVQSGFTANELVMVGDAIFDIEMAHAANVRNVAVSYGIQPIEALRTANPDFEIDSIEQLLSWFVAT